MFNEWKAARNDIAIKQDCNTSIIRVELIEMTKDELCHNLSLFVLEARKRSGEDYPAKTLYELTIPLQLCLTSQGEENKFLDDKGFVTLKNSLNARMKELSATGKIVKRKQAGTISYEEEDSLWCKGILGTDTPQKLFDTMMYKSGLHFASRAGQQYRNLRAVDSQLSVHTDTGGRRLLRCQVMKRMHPKNIFLRKAGNS